MMVALSDFIEGSVVNCGRTEAEISGGSAVSSSRVTHAWCECLQSNNKKYLQYKFIVSNRKGDVINVFMRASKTEQDTVFNLKSSTNPEKVYSYSSSTGIVTVGGEPGVPEDLIFLGVDFQNVIIFVKKALLSK